MRIVIFLAVVICGYCELVASERGNHSRDSSAESLSGRFIVTAKSPSVREWGQNPKLAFDYQCIDRDTNQALWTIDANDVARRDVLSFKPAEIFVSDDAWSVVCSTSNQLVTISPEGQVSASIDLVDDGITKADRDRFEVQQGKLGGGDNWKWNSLSYFVDNGNQLLFVIRPFWGKHIIVEVEHCRLVTATPQIDELTKAYEAQFVREKLSAAADSVDDEAPTDHEIALAMRGASRSRYFELIKQREENRRCKKVLDEALVAIWLAGKIDHQDSVVSLRIIEKCRLQIGSRGIRRGRCEIRGCYIFRQFAQLSLRRLGRVPASLPAYALFAPSKQAVGIGLVELARNPDRSENESLAGEGTKLEDVVQLLGAPDLITFGFKRTWTYDFDQPKPHSLALTFDSTGAESIVTQVVRVTPSTWKIGCMREDEMRKI